MDNVSDLSMGFRAKLGNTWSLCNHVETSKQVYIIAFTNPAQLSEEVLLLLFGKSVSSY